MFEHHLVGQDVYFKDVKSVYDILSTYQNFITLYNLEFLGNREYMLSNDLNDMAKAVLNKIIYENRNGRYFEKIINKWHIVNDLTNLHDNVILGKTGAN